MLRLHQLVCWFIISPFRFTRKMGTDGNRCQRVIDVKGLDDRKNDIIYCPPKKPDDGRVVVYFGGDIQDYKERMEKHRDNRRHAEERNLERTALSLSRKFPSSSIVIFKPHRMFLGSFACYSNFLQCNDIGAPVQCPPIDSRAWEHLKLLLDSVGPGITPPKDFGNAPVSLIGFSKGAVVLNQLVYELQFLTSNSIADGMVNRIRAWYWLDGAHAGSKNTWITDEQVLGVLADRANRNRVRIYAHVTPRQVRDPGRPWVGEEEAKFTRILKHKMGDIYLRKLHFENESGSLEHHFRVLDVFEPDVA